ncbi:response regulator, partial [Streptomyces tailanensis]|uniref:response regulator n=1 Tax=Streptomyces tailanensis TaxID=2569858 RepID=UPI001FE988EF
MSLNVVLAEDSALMRDGLVGVLTRFGHKVLAAVGDADALIGAVREHDPDIVVTDVRMPPDNTDDGLRAAVALRDEHPTL